MNDPVFCTAFAGPRRIAQGPLADVAMAVAAAASDAGILVFDDATGRVIDLDLRGPPDEIAARYAPAEAPRPRGRPKLGVVAREVTLLPRHWDWLNAQAGGASQALRRLIDEARRADDGRTERRLALEVAYRFMSAMAGNLAGFEEASRALFAEDRARFAEQAAAWPADIRNHVEALAWP
jgi:hypothetical protein